MMRVGPIALTNAPAGGLFNDEEIFGTKTDKIILYGDRDASLVWSENKISLEIEEAYVWEVLDAIITQLPKCKSWDIYEEKNKRYGFRYAIGFYEKDRDIWEQRYIDLRKGITQ